MDYNVKADGWTDEAMTFAKIKVVCNQCYIEIKERNQAFF